MIDDYVVGAVPDPEVVSLAGVGSVPDTDVSDYHVARAADVEECSQDTGVRSRDGDTGSGRRRCVDGYVVSGYADRALELYRAADRERDLAIRGADRVTERAGSRVGQRCHYVALATSTTHRVRTESLKRPCGRRRRASEQHAQQQQER